MNVGMCSVYELRRLARIYEREDVCTYVDTQEFIRGCVSVYESQYVYLTTIIIVYRVCLFLWLLRFVVSVVNEDIQYNTSIIIKERICFKVCVNNVCVHGMRMHDCTCMCIYIHIYTYILYI